jgi:general secretion pathway protein I
MSARRHARARGFTLIEVLVALAIVTLGMAALLGTLSSAANTTAFLQDKTLAEWIALNQVSKVRLTSQPPSKGDSEGEIDYAGRKWKWTQKVDDMQIQGVLSVVVKVRPSDVAAGGDNAWFAEVTGVVGDAVGAPRGDLPSWNITPGPAAPGGATGAPATPSNTPGAPGQTQPLTPFNTAAPPVVPQTNGPQSVVPQT